MLSVRESVCYISKVYIQDALKPFSNIKKGGKKGGAKEKEKNVWFRKKTSLVYKPSGAKRNEKQVASLDLEFI